MTTRPLSDVLRGVAVACALVLATTGCGDKGKPAANKKDTKETTDAAKPVVTITASKDQILVVADANDATKVAKVLFGASSFEPAGVDKISDAIQAAPPADGQEITLTAPPQIRYGDMEPLLIAVASSGVRAFIVESKVDASGVDALKKLTPALPNEERARMNLTRRGANDATKILRPINIILTARESNVTIEIDAAPSPVDRLETLARVLRSLQEPEGPYEKDRPVIVRPKADVPWGYVVGAMRAAEKVKYTNVGLARTAE